MNCSIQVDEVTDYSQIWGHALALLLLVMNPNLAEWHAHVPGSWPCNKFYTHTIDCSQLNTMIFILIIFFSPEYSRTEKVLEETSQMPSYHLNSWVIYCTFWI